MDNLTQLLQDTTDHFCRQFFVGARFVKPQRRGSRLWLTTYDIESFVVEKGLYRDILKAKCWNVEDEKRVTVELNNLCVIA